MPILDELAAWMRARSGVAHSSAIRAAGFSDHHVARAVAAGLLRRIRRSWLVTADCDPGFVAAAQLGGRLTCVSAAERMGLWVPPHQGFHVAVASSSSRLASEGVTVHWARPPVPLAQRQPSDHVVNVLFHVARCLDRTSAAAVWESALRTRLVDVPLLERVQWHSNRARELVTLASDASDAGTETQFRLLMDDLGVRMQQQVWVDGHPVDGLIGDRLVVQVDGFAHHSSPADRRRDIRADARLALRGFTVLRFDYQQVFYDSAYVMDAVLTAIAQGLHLFARTGKQPGTGRFSPKRPVSG